MAYISNLQHYLDSNGSFPVDMPGPARELATFLGMVVTAATSAKDVAGLQTTVPCRMRHTAGCAGTLRAGFLVPEDSIQWTCPVCGDEGFISGWQGTAWDKASPSGE